MILERGGTMNAKGITLNLNQYKIEVKFNIKKQAKSLTRAERFIHHYQQDKDVQQMREARSQLLDQTIF